MVMNRSKHTGRSPVPQGSRKSYSEPNKIAANTPFDFSGKNLTPYGGLLPVATMLEKLGFKKLVEEIWTRLLWTLTPPCTPSTATRWAGANPTTRKTKARK